MWLRTPAVPYLAVCGIATLLLCGLAVREGRLALVCALAALGFSVVAGLAQRSLQRIDGNWSGYRAELEFGSAEALQRALVRVAAELRASAAAALEAPADPAGRFDHLERLVDGREDRGVVMYDNGRPVAWGGSVRVATDPAPAGLGVFRTPFYLVLYATAERESRRTVATSIIHADEPADRLSQPLDVEVARRSGVREFLYDDGPNVPAGFTTFASGNDTLFAARPAPIAQGEARLRALESARVRGSLLLALTLLVVLAGAWRAPTGLALRLGSLLLALGALAVVPLNAFSNLTSVFDPAVYYVPLGGPLTGSVGALAASSALVLLGVLTVLRGAPLTRSRWLAVAVVMLIASLAPFLLRDLARGISPPPWGISTPLWIWWQVAIFLAAAALLLAGASAGRVALGARRGLPPMIAPVMAGVAGLLAPVLWAAPGQWPPWYPVLWIVAMAALALTRRSRGFVLNAAIVAAIGSLVLVWGTTSRRRLALAERDVTGLMQVDNNAAMLLGRMARDLADGPAPLDRAGLLKEYVRSDLDDAGNPVQLTTWTRTSSGTYQPGATLVLSDFLQPAASVAAVVDEAAVSGQPVIRAADGFAGVDLYLAVPHGNDQYTSVAVAPRTRLIPGDPFSVLLGLAPESATEAPYTLALESVPMGTEPRDRPWERNGNEMHGDWRVHTLRGPTRAHVEVELRSVPALLQRGVLLVLLDLVLLAALWTVSAAADGGLGRWTRRRARTWSTSYRARLTFSLFAFFVAPAVTFAVWSYGRLQSDDRQSRELLLRETLRSFAAEGRYDSLASESDRLDVPLFVYRQGNLQATSDPLYELLAPVGLLLPPPIELLLDIENEVSAGYRTRIGALPALFGYRSAIADGGATRIVVGAPARSDELALDRQRRDLGTLVLFATAMGALAALGLSGIAARTIARPIGELRNAALAIGEGARRTELADQPPREFMPVYAAFRHMTADLTASRTALEQAQRRTEAVLRNVASGVLAVSGSGHISLANPRVETMLGRGFTPGTPLASVDGTGLHERVHAFLEATADEEDFDVFMHGRQLRGRLTRLHSAGGGVVVTLEDVTEVARAQRVLAWGEMARQVAHEIKNPLTPIRLGVQHLKRAHGDERVDYEQVLAQNVARILAEIDRLDEIARAFSRYGRAPAEREQGEVVDVSDVLRDVVELERMGEGRVAWMLDDPSEAVHAIARAEELREVLLNVLENARLANAASVRIGIERSADHVNVVVEDDGDGIAAEVLPRVFEPHFSTRTSGSGLGLAISRTLVNGWGGDITIESEAGEGTRVTITLASPPAAEQT
jgi:signal transduction histidine kinase